MGHLISPKGWLVVMANEVDPNGKSGWRVVRPSPVVVLPPARLADIGGQCAEGEAGVSEILLGWAKREPPSPPWFELALGWRRYWVKLAPSWAASAPLSAPAHRLQILCADRRCDLSPLFALADPLHYPQYAAQIVRAHVDADGDRWLPICDYIDCKNTIFSLPGYESSFGKGALDILSNPAKVRILFKLTYDRSKETRKIGYRLGLWTLDPDAEPRDLSIRGEFTATATAALGLVYHMNMTSRVDRYLRLRLVSAVA